MYHTAKRKTTQQVNVLAGRREILLTTIKHRKLSLFSQVCRYDIPPKTILEDG